MGGHQGPGDARGAHASHADRDESRSAAKSLGQRSRIPEEGASGPHAVSAGPLRRDDVAAAAVGHHAGVHDALLSHHDREIPRQRGRDYDVVRHV